MSALEIRQFPCLSDNYSFLIHDPDSGETVVIDTPDAKAIEAEAAAAGWTITQIWNTHHHWDHAGGNTELKAATKAHVVAPKADQNRIESVDQWVQDGDTVMLGQHRADVYFTPGHTLGHVCYHFPDQKIAFVGDTLFAVNGLSVRRGATAQEFAGLLKQVGRPVFVAFRHATEHELAADAAFSASPPHSPMCTRLTFAAAGARFLCPAK